MQTISKDTKENIHIGKINNRAETFNHHKIYASNNISEKIIKLQLKAMETGRSIHHHLSIFWRRSRKL